MATLRLEIVTPDTKTFSDDVEMVVVPGAEGELGIFPQHVPLLTNIKPGELTVRRRGQSIHLAVGEGFVEVTQTSVSVNTDMAIEEKEIDEAAAQAAIARAQEAMRHPHINDEEVASVQASLNKSLA